MCLMYDQWNAYFPNLLCLGQKLKLEILKIKDLKTPNRDCKKATKQGSRYTVFSWISLIHHLYGS